MTEELQKIGSTDQLNKNLREQTVQGSRRASNYSVAILMSVGGVGFLLASLSSFKGQDFLPIGHPSTLIFAPQGLVMGLYGVGALLFALYLWTLISVDVGSGSNIFNKSTGLLYMSRRGLLREIKLEIPLKEIKAVKLEVRDGINPRRRVTLRVQGRKDVPLTGVGKLSALNQVEQEGAELARFLGVNLEGI